MLYLVCFEPLFTGCYRVIRIYKKLDEALCFMLDKVVIENKVTTELGGYFMSQIEEDNMIDISKLLKNTTSWISHENNIYYISLSGNIGIKLDDMKFIFKLDFLNRLNSKTKEELHNLYELMSMRQYNKIFMMIFISKKELIKRIYEYSIINDINIKNIM